MNSRQLTKLQEVYFDLCDLINSYQCKSIRIKGFQEFKTIQEFLIEQRDKLAEIEQEEVA